MNKKKSESILKEKKMTNHLALAIMVAVFLTTGFVLDIRIGLNIGIAALLIITGAVFCNIGIREEI